MNILRRWLPVRMAVGAKNRILSAVRPVLIPLRDWEAPRLHRFMMHGASFPDSPTRKTALVIAAHQDDETFGCGGIIALKRQWDVDVDIVILTDGKQSHGNSPEVDFTNLIQTRRAEALAATSALGVPADRVQFFDLPDQGLRLIEPPLRALAVDRLALLMARVSPGEIFTHHRFDQHPDHEAAFAITIDALTKSGIEAQVLQYPIWLIWKGPPRVSLRPPDLSKTMQIDVRTVQAIKDQAIQIYASQLPVLPKGFIKQFTQGYEIFFT